ncbi:MAG: hypothetical protein MUE69_34495, partial [Myxococcota bacterium]|nr:hypothetical protein [Myxococcota bacterium]
MDGEVPRHARILFVGSSSTYWSDQPEQLRSWIDLFHPAWTAEVSMIGRSGTDYPDYLAPGFEAEYGLPAGMSVLELVRDGDWDFVVVQVNVHKWSPSFDAALVRFVEAARDGGAATVIYEMGWRNSDVVVTDVYRFAADHEVLVAPCRSLWLMTRDELGLHDVFDQRFKEPDGPHPGELGTLL